MAGVTVLNGTVLNSLRIRKAENHSFRQILTG